MESDATVFLYGYSAVLSALACRPQKSLMHLFCMKTRVNEIFYKDFKRRLGLMHFVLQNDERLRGVRSSHVSCGQLTQMCQSCEHDGFVLQCAAWRDNDVVTKEWCDLVHTFPPNKKIFLYPIGVRNPVNLGKIAKTCEFFDIGMLLPLKHSVRTTASAFYESDGALERISIVKTSGPPRNTLELLRENGFNIVMTVSGLNERPHCSPMSPESPCVIVLGSERNGIEKENRSLGTHELALLPPDVRQIPKQNLRVDSLNVNTAAALSIVAVQNARGKASHGLYCLKSVL
ncbi:GTP-binding protein [Perkinsela sp. CCAP 1560/4]|nr:GTP-binding protein [Perkinsela sp. CCAP 1560/4]|eukprot:KNH04775.1 GTP-binding protein [Perkinsela sp. CCAP 1560/4]